MSQALTDEALRPVALPLPTAVLRAVWDGRRLGLQAAYVDGMGQRLKAAGAAWFAPRRMWVVHALASAQEAVPWLQQALLGARTDLEAAEVLLRHSTAPDPDYFTQLLDAQVFPVEGGGLAFTSEYDPAVVKAMRALGGRFHQPARAWQLRAGAVDIEQALWDVAGLRAEFVFWHERAVVLERLADAGGNTISIAVPAATPSSPLAGAGAADSAADGSLFMSVLADPARAVEVDEAALASAAQMTGLRDYQLAGVRHLASATGACLGDDMGLGKTRQAVVAARCVAGTARVLVLCPASLRINWEREIRAVYPDAIVGMVGEDRIAALHGCNWVVANYERLGGLVRETELTFAVMLVDEAHYLKDHKTGRTRNAFVLASRIDRRYVITGTPLLNREVELHTLLRLTGHALGHLELGEFRKRFSGDKAKRAALAQALRGWMLRRRKDVLVDLGTKHRQVRYVSPAEGLASYQAILQDQRLTVMPKIVKLRQALEALKIDFLVETLTSLGQDDKAIVFCEYMSTVSALQEALQAAGLGCVSLVGSDAGPKRQRAIDGFQNDPTISVFIGTTSAAGVGITLTAANYVLFASMPWTPALMRQAEDRAYRLGQRRDVYVLVPLVAGTLDEQIWTLLESKSELEQDVVEAVRAAL